MAYEDAKHRPHAIHTGETPRNPITNGPESLVVTLDRWGPQDGLFPSMYDSLQANWGERPSRVVDRICPILEENSTWRDDVKDAHAMSWEHKTGWCLLATDERDYVEACFAGKTLQQVLEGVTFDFCIDGVSRAFTHQNVRTRLGAGFMQHGGRDNDWRHRPWTMPETMRRMCQYSKDADFGSTAGVPWVASEEDLKPCIADWEPIETFLNKESGGAANIRIAIEEHIMHGRKLYAALVDAGIPWQDARRVLFMGMQTYIHDQYNYLALQGVLANRLEHIMDWEFNCVAQLMLREIKMKCPPLISKYLGSHSDKAKTARFAGLESWPSDGKYPNPYERCELCGCNEGNHDKQHDICEVCLRSGDRKKAYHKYVAKDSLTRQHRPEQMPFFVLHPDSMAGGPIVWIPTNGSYPHDVIAAATEK